MASIWRHEEATGVELKALSRHHGAAIVDSKYHGASMATPWGRHGGLKALWQHGAPMAHHWTAIAGLKAPWYHHGG